MADGQITFAGQPLLLNVAEFQEWMDAWFPLSDLQFIASPLWQHNHRLASKSGNPNPVGLPRPNYPPFPPAPLVKLNTLYWPTGAARWAFAFFVVDSQTKDSLPESGSLKLGDGTTILDTEMHRLQPRQITAREAGGAWLIPLVDERYFWQFKNVGHMEAQTGTTWSELYLLLADEIGGSGSAILNDEVSSDYLSPDPQELTRRFENAAGVLDAVAHSVGHRVIRLLNGGVIAINWNTSSQLLDASRSRGADSIIAGDSFEQDLPADIRVVFPKMREYRPYSERPYSIATPERQTVATKLIGLGGTLGTKIVHSTCFALTSATTETPITNQTQLDALALLIATDFANSLSHGYDLTYTGLVDWSPNGYDDHIEWTIGRLHNGEHGEYLVRTRVQSAAVNFGTEEQLSQQSTQFVLPKFIKGKLDDALTQGGQATVSVWYHDGTNDVDTGINIEAFDWVMAVGAAAIPAGSKCFVEWNETENRWNVIQVECPPE